jgi:hypothetical protein
MMREKPGFDHRPIKTMKVRNCVHCQHFDENLQRCSQEKCVLFDD